MRLKNGRPCKGLVDIFDVAGIWEPDALRRAQVAAEPEYRGARWLTEAEVFGDRSIRAAVVETELPDLLTMGRRCLEAGWHLHLDKPAGTDLAPSPRCSNSRRASASSCSSATCCGIIRRSGFASTAHRQGLARRRVRHFRRQGQGDRSGPSALAGG
jgi:hypothetical protein